MKKLKFYVCPGCGNLLAATAEASVCCCGKRLSPLLPAEAEGEHRLLAERLENEYFISSPHPMTKAHHISFVAFLSGDSLLLKKLYPEWDLQCRIPCMGHGLLLWHCTEHGLFHARI